jgi:hypothetical protein
LKLNGHPALAQIDQVPRAERVLPSPEEQFHAALAKNISA